MRRILLHSFSNSLVITLALLAVPSNASGAGTVIAWCGDSVGQLDACATNVVAIATGYQQSLLLKSDGTVADCGTFWEQEASIPITVPVGLSNVVSVAGGYSHSLALKADGTVVVWGSNTYGQTNVPPDLTNVVAISAADYHSLALKADGTVATWGSPGYPVPAGLVDVVAISAGTANLALRGDGTVVGWGSSSTLSSSLAGLSNIVAISYGWSGGWDEWYAVTADGTVLGYFHPANLTNIVAVCASSGTDHHVNLAIKADGTVIGWGFNFCGGQMVPPGLSNVVAVSSDSTHSLALVGDGPPVLHGLLTNPARDSDGFSVSVPTQNGKVYRLEYKNSISDANWIPLPLVAGNGHVQTLTDTHVTGEQRFYHVRQW